MTPAVLDAAVAHVATREALGCTLSQLKRVVAPVADVATTVYAARLLVRSAACA